ncbi:MAG: 4Fe-4S dicluster domain-containing protein [Anaerolineales bacterium]
MQRIETQTRQQYYIELDAANCDGCRKCLPSCSYTALIWVHAENELLVDTWACTGCGSCVTVCPQKALSLRPRDVR